MRIKEFYRIIDDDDYYNDDEDDGHHDHDKLAEEIISLSNTRLNDYIFPVWIKSFFFRKIFLSFHKLKLMIMKINIMIINNFVDKITKQIK